MSAQPAVRERQPDSVERMQAAVAELKPALAAYARDHGGRFILFGSAAAVGETLGFRHFASHAYDAPFENGRARPAVEAGLIIADRFESELRAFIESLGAG